jgi:hypothetical protein
MQAMTRAVAFVHRHGLRLGFLLYGSVIVAVLVCGALLKWSIS